MLTLKVDTKLILHLNLEVEKIYAQICYQKKLLISNLVGDQQEEEEFLTNFPPRLLRKAARVLCKDAQVTSCRFVRDSCSLEITKDAKDPTAVHVRFTSD